MNAPTAARMCVWMLVTALGEFASGPADAAPKSSPTAVAASNRAVLAFGHAKPGELPDSVVARIAGRRDVSVAQLREAASADAAEAASRSTPGGAARFLEVLVDRELLGEAAARERWDWTAADSSRIDALADRLALTFVLDSALAETHGDLADRPTSEDAGIRARDATLSRVGVRIDSTVIERVLPAWTRLPRLTADSSLQAQLRAMSALPEVAASDTDRVLARSPLGSYRVRDLLSAWRKLHPAYRPRVDQAGHIEDLVRNGVFEQILRRQVELGGWKQRAEVQSAVARLRESLAVERLIRRDAVPGEAPTEALERWYRLHIERWRIPTRLRAIRLVNDSREAAERSATLLRDAAAAESLVARAHRSGAEFVAEMTASTDSVLFAAGMQAGTGEVVGPLPIGNDWGVARISAVLPGRTAALDEVRNEVETQWRAAETERRLHTLCDRLAREFPVIVNDSALRRFEEDASRAGAATQGP